MNTIVCQGELSGALLFVYPFLGVLHRSRPGQGRREWNGGVVVAADVHIVNSPVIIPLIIYVALSR